MGTADAVLTRFAGRVGTAPWVLGAGAVGGVARAVGGVASVTEHVAWASCAQVASAIASLGKLCRRSQTADSMVWAMKTGGVPGARQGIHPALAASRTGGEGESAGSRVASQRTRSYAAFGGAYAYCEAIAESTPTASSAAPPSSWIAASSSIHVHSCAAAPDEAEANRGEQLDVIAVVVRGREVGVGARTNDVGMNLSGG